jgi:hypothetical protein
MAKKYLGQSNENFAVTATKLYRLIYRIAQPKVAPTGRNEFASNAGG